MKIRRTQLLITGRFRLQADASRRTWQRAAVEWCVNAYKQDKTRTNRVLVTGQGRLDTGFDTRPPSQTDPFRYTGGLPREGDSSTPLPA